MWHDRFGEQGNDPDMREVAEHFDGEALKHICTLRERKFGREFGMTKTTVVGERAGDDFYFHRDVGSNVLAVAHLDTVARPEQRTARIVDTEAGLVVHSRALDDRLGAYIILDLLPKLGINYDVLLTVGEESGNSSAQHFSTDKEYDWMIEFDRGGTDVVMYEYDDAEVREMVENADAVVGDGIFSDICYLGQLGIKGFNWGVGYRDYHEARAHAYLDDTFSMVARYVRFHEQNKGTAMPHFPSRRSQAHWWDEELDTATQARGADISDLSLPVSEDWDDEPEWYRQQRLG